MFEELLTFLQHAHFQTLHEATGLTGLASPLCDLTLVGGRTAVLYVTWEEEARAKVRTPVNFFLYWMSHDHEILYVCIY